ncbi:hypothetical protein [Methanoregula sp.]|jgi:hypothetical protein|uniref:hypothetical protein n=1 Tax=Methanoregula sp. TaxID=2052170 RepID=UPI0025E1F8A7|nr:hypothetical protein [Methanoregula sp.]
MDNLVGVVAFAIFYATIILVAYGIFQLVVMVVQAYLSGNYLFFGEIISCIGVAVLLYVAVGLWLQKTGTI